MEGESLVELKAAFEKWRSKKRHVREAVPAELLQRARAAAGRHGWAAVARETKVDRGRLETDRSRGGKRRVAGAGVPLYSRVELAAPTATARPFAEVEMPTGLKVRLFTETGEALRLLSSLLGAGGPPMIQVRPNANVVVMHESINFRCGIVQTLVIAMAIDVAGGAVRCCGTDLTPMAKPALDLTKLTPEEKLDLIDELWTSITPEEFPLTTEQRAELHQRLDRLDEEGAVGVSWESVRLEMTRGS